MARRGSRPVVAAILLLGFPAAAAGECLAAVFSQNGRVRYVDRPEMFPATTVWSNDRLPELPNPPRGGSALTDLDEADAEAWLIAPRGTQLFAQTLFQRDGYRITLLLAEPAEEQ